MWVPEMTTTTDEASSSSSTVILYLSPSLHHLPLVSEVPDTSGAGDGSRQLSVEPFSCGSLPVSSEPLQSYVTSAVQGTVQPADDATNGPLDVTTDVTQHCPNYSNGISLVQRGLSPESAEVAVLHIEDVVGQQPKAFSLIQATLSSEVMSAVSGLDCWDVLLTAASACCVQLLHDANDGVYIAVGYTLHGFYELERMLQSLLTGIISSHVTDKPQPDAVHSCVDSSPSSSPPVAAAVDSADVSSSSLSQLSEGSKSNVLSASTKPSSLAVDVALQLHNSSQQASSHCEPVAREIESTTLLPVSVLRDIDTQSQTSLQNVPDDFAENKKETLFTKSGRLVKSKNFADFTSSDITLKDSARNSLPAEKTNMKRRRSRLRKCTSSVCSRDIHCLDDVHQSSVINQKQDTSATSSAQQHVTEHQSDETASSNTITERGTWKRQQLQDTSTLLLYNGRTRLDSREYEQLMPYRFFCTQCSFRSKREGHMTKHLELHARGVAVLKCPVCGYRTTRTSHLTRHQLCQHSKSAAIVCSVDGCTYIASNERLFQRHVKSCHKSTPTQTSSSFPCTVPGCSYSGATESRLIRHRARHRAVEGQQLDTDLVECYQCTQCAYKTVHREHFRRHVDSVHKNVRPFLCDVCGRRFKRHDALLQHRVVHSDDSDTSLWSGNHQCAVCQRTFRSKSHLSDHESIHRTCRSFVCSVCGATFKTRAVHRKHLLTIHTQPGAHVCHACGRLFNTSFAMKRHSRMHQLQMNSVDITANTATFCLQPPQPTAAQMDSLQSVNDGGSSSM